MFSLEIWYRCHKSAGQISGWPVQVPPLILGPRGRGRLIGPAG
jgi:hypothetical protein